MYSPLIVDQNLRTLEKSRGITIKRYDDRQVADVVDHLDKLLDEKGKPKRPLGADEKEFIRNERLRSKFDFIHWSRNYCTIIRSGSLGGGLSKLVPLTSQEILLDMIGRREEENYGIIAEGGIAPGILVADHKGARQIGHTMIARAICMHREIFWGHTRGLAASIDDDKIQELYDRDKLILDSLPWWMRPELKFDVKSDHIELEGIGSKLLYQINSQKTGIGQGRSFDIAHMTEVAMFVGAERLEFEFFPTIPRAKSTFCLMETTANGRTGWWREFSDKARMGRFDRWIYLFLPWYTEPKLNIATPREGWTPSSVTLQMKEVAERTSYEFTKRKYSLTDQQLYWWELEHDQARERGTLNMFFSNYATTVEESFQFSGISTFSIDLLESLRAKAQWGLPFQIAKAC